MNKVQLILQPVLAGALMLALSGCSGSASQEKTSRRAAVESQPQSASQEAVAAETPKETAPKQELVPQGAAVQAAATNETSKTKDRSALYAYLDKHKASGTLTVDTLKKGLGVERFDIDQVTKDADLVKDLWDRGYLTKAMLVDIIKTFPPDQMDPPKLLKFGVAIGLPVETMMQIVVEVVSQYDFQQ